MYDNIKMAKIIDISYVQHTGNRFNDDDDDLTFHMDGMIDELNPYLSQYNPSRGDIFYIVEFDDYRNEGKFLWDGEKGVPFTYDILDYGSIPSVFTIGDEFLADHWTDVIGHIDLVWVDSKKYRNQLLSNMYNDGTFYDTDMGTFHIEGDSTILYRIISDRDVIFLETIDSHRMMILQ